MIIAAPTSRIMEKTPYKAAGDSLVAGKRLPVNCKFQKLKNILCDRRKGAEGFDDCKYSL
jgi:hypothetical protein